jgi:hypothetical protein
LFAASGRSCQLSAVSYQLFRPLKLTAES